MPSTVCKDRMEADRLVLRFSIISDKNEQQIHWKETVYVKNVQINDNIKTVYCSWTKSQIR